MKLVNVSSICNPKSETYNRLALPEFFIKLLTDESDVILDFFAGSNTTGFVAESLHRRWIVLENVDDYLKARKFRLISPVSFMHFNVEGNS
jgi:DNA modification methylase